MHASTFKVQRCVQQIKT